MDIVKSRNGYSVPSFQHNDNYDDSRVEYITTVCSQVPSFGSGSQVIIDFKEYGVQVLDQWVAISVGAITGMTGSPMYVPSQFFYNNIQIFQGGKALENILPEENFLCQQMLLNDQDRLYDNAMSGLYSSTAKRITLASGANVYVTPLWNFVKQSTALVLNPSHDMQIKITLNPTAQIISGGTGTGASSVSALSLISRVKRLSKNAILDFENSLYNHGKLFFKFNDIRNAPYQVPSGSSSSDLVLNAFNGYVSLIWFIVRPTSNLSGNGLFSFTAVAQYEILDSAGKNIVGGIPITHQQALLLMGNQICASSYLTENAIGTGTDNGANVYCYAFCNDVESTVHYGMHTGAQKFNGTERLKITYSSALGSNYQVDVYAFNSAGIEYRLDGVEKKDIYIH